VRRSRLAGKRPAKKQGKPLSVIYGIRYRTSTVRQSAARAKKNLLLQ
jgi:hypothetical protein